MSKQKKYWLRGIALALLVSFVWVAFYFTFKNDFYYLSIMMTYVSVIFTILPIIITGFLMNLLWPNFDRSYDYIIPALIIGFTFFTIQMSVIGGIIGYLYGKIKSRNNAK